MFVPEFGAQMYTIPGVLEEEEVKQQRHKNKI
jgi:heme/copper-type cytochrome/quinol oxidase subunit 2